MSNYQRTEAPEGYPEVPVSIFEHLLKLYGNSLSFDEAFNAFLDNYRLTRDDKEEMDEKELEQHQELISSIRKEAFEELKFYLDEIKERRSVLKEYLEIEDMSDELREEIQRVLKDTKITIEQLGSISPEAIHGMIKLLIDEIDSILIDLEDEEEEMLEEDREYRREQDEEMELSNYAERPVIISTRHNEYEEYKDEYQPSVIMPYDLPGFDKQRVSWPSDGIEERPIVDESAKREAEYYQGQIQRLQQLILADTENTNNDYYINLIGQMRQKIAESQGILHDHVNYHIGPQDMGIEIFEYEKNNPLLNRPMVYQNAINNKMVSMGHIRDDPEVQRRTNRIFIEGKYQFSPAKGFMPETPRTQWDSMIEGREIGWAKAYPGNIEGYNRGLFGSRFSKRSKPIEEEVADEMRSELEPSKKYHYMRAF